MTASKIFQHIQRVLGIGDDASADFDGAFHAGDVSFALAWSTILRMRDRNQIMYDHYGPGTQMPKRPRIVFVLQPHVAGVENVAAADIGSRHHPAPQKRFCDCAEP